jgi:uncharacterized protein DUF2459
MRVKETTFRQVACACGLLFSAYACAAPVPELWPPAQETLQRTIHVSVDSWHAMIAFPSESTGNGDESPADKPLYEEWGYAERAWYLEGRQGLGGVIRALFFPSAGVVEVSVHDRIWAERTTQPPAEMFTFQLSQDGYLRLRRYLFSTTASMNPVVVSGTSRFYPARSSYHMFHQCHQYAARALREAGLPISSVAAFTRSSFAMQLRRAQNWSQSPVMRTP